MKAATQAVQVTDQMLDFEITAEEAAKQLERLSNRMEKGTGCCTTKPATPTRKSGVAEQRKCRFPTLSLIHI